MGPRQIDLRVVRFLIALLILSAGGTVGAWATAHAADTIFKTSGGKVSGQILRDESTDEVVVIKTSSGKVKIAADQIDRIVTDKQRTEQRMAKAKEFPETADDQFQFALWLKQNDYPDEYFQTLSKVVELAPDHAEARKRLNHVLVDGVWQPRDQAMEKQGYVKYRGKFVLPQERDLAEQKLVLQKQQQEQFKRIKMLQGWLKDGKKASRAETELLQMSDPAAAKPLMAVLYEKGKPNERALVARVLPNIETDESTSYLARLALNDTEAEIREYAVEGLKTRKSPELLAMMMATLRDSDNQKVRNAAVVLGAFADRSAAPALIDALVTRHKKVIEVQVRDPRQRVQINANDTYLLPDGSVVQVPNQESILMATQGVATTHKVQVEEDKKNEEVLEALRGITGQAFGYEKQTWLNWIRANYTDLKLDKPAAAGKPAAKAGKKPGLEKAPADL